MTGLERWRGKVALVTGASSGIGEAMARALAGIGMRVALAARRTERLAALQAALETSGSDVLAIPCDLEQAGGPATLFGALRERWGGVDVLVNNAGLLEVQPFGRGDRRRWDAMLDVNLRAVVLCTREALRDLEGREEGAIVNVSSLSAHRVPPGGGYSVYSASKQAMSAFTNGLRNELALAGRTVKLGMISPDVVATELFSAAVGGGEPPARQYAPLQPEDVAGALLYVLSTPRNVQINDIVMRPMHQPT